MKHLKYFPDAAAIGNGIEVDLPNVSYLEGKNVLYIPGENGTATIKVDGSGNIEAEIKPDYSQMYLTFEAIESGTFKFSNTISYSIDNGTTWITLSANTDTPTINVGNTIMWKGKLTPQTNKGIGTFSATGNFNAYGNPMSLLYGDNFIGQTDLTWKKYAFCQLFYNTRVINAQNLVLPATILAANCYSAMFMGCKSLTAAPALPATTLISNCYQSMFNGCTGLTTVPAILPATTLTGYCYAFMFNSCTSLTTAPVLPATTLANNCYNGMFNNCSSLNYIKMLATDVSASGALSNWVKGVASSGTFIKNSAATWTTTGVNGIPSGWTVVYA